MAAQRTLWKRTLRRENEVLKSIRTVSGFLWIILPWSCPSWSYQDTNTGWTGRGLELLCSNQPAASVKEKTNLFTMIYLIKRKSCSSVFFRIKLYHLIKNITGEKVILDIGDLDSHWDAVIIGPLLQKRQIIHKLRKDWSSSVWLN